MSLEGLLAIAGIVVAVYAVAQPIQRRSIGLFVPMWLVLGSLAVSAGILFWRQAASTFGYEFFPWPDFTLTVISFALPVIATFAAIALWHIARLSKRKDKRFRSFVLACLHEGRFDELVRIMERNYTRLAVACKAETVDLLFETRFIHAMVQARTWIHLRLLTDDALLGLLSDQAVHRTLRELLLADDSPLRISVILSEGGDETLHCTDAERCLIDSTFHNPQWYHRCRVGYPLLIAACERIDSGDLDMAYNRPDARYTTGQGVATRTNCPIFLAEKVIAYALKRSLEEGTASSSEIHADAADLWDLFNTVYHHSKYRRETWDEPWGYGDYPTPFGFLLAEILSDYRWMCYEAWRRSDYGAKPPPEIVAPVARMWAHCVMYLRGHKDNVSPKFRMSSAISYLDWTLERRNAQVKASEKSESEGAWANVFIDGLKEAATSWGQDGKECLTDAANSLDMCKAYILANHQWLRDELGLPPRPRPQR